MENAIRGLTEAIEKLASSGYDIVDYIAIFISLIAIVVSVYGIYIQRKLNNVNLQSTYFKEIFGVYLKEKIPESSSKLAYDEDLVTLAAMTELNREKQAMNIINIHKKIGCIVLFINKEFQHY